MIGWSAPVLFANLRRQVFLRRDPYKTEHISYSNYEARHPGYKTFFCLSQVTSRLSVVVCSAIVLHLVGDWLATSSE